MSSHLHCLCPSLSPKLDMFMLEAVLWIPRKHLKKIKNLCQKLLPSLSLVIKFNWKTDIKYASSLHFENMNNICNRPKTVLEMLPHYSNTNGSTLYYQLVSSFFGRTRKKICWASACDLHSQICLFTSLKSTLVTVAKAVAKTTYPWI